ncbi:ABC transporter ATP-binding protein [Paractinoplanes abujensis]|uniref:ABC-2 type transport system ATP-binding protein n=1 Tax=Paractinoplanes abujensis TaxID=882441 RepID=A0A7W7CSQ9_9ACTN|nr:ATP-binding cassette domain-containing protein [Actinoplanes abujensis]MBB4694036.1 ABC-2 type transport system ATP-binding protein [Actinoplanes abujensis]GID21306.1 ABC transporter ATP-binding protein [Actinoplanes abujensis]
MIETQALTKRFGQMDAVRDVTFTAAPGRVTGFLGMNGSGKTTTLRMLLGLSRPTSGRALINGQRYRDLTDPLRQVGAVLEQGLMHPGQTGRGHLHTQALLGGVGKQRTEHLLEYVGLADAATMRTGDYSLGMRQRLAVATALLGEPPVLVLDEPANGLDPSGMAWLRGLLRDHAAAGGTVLISSHLLAELELLIDDVVIIAGGRVRLAEPLSFESHLRVRGRDPHRLWQAFEQVGATVRTDGSVLFVTGISPEDAGELALHVQVPLYELTVETPSLEKLFLDLAAAA